MDQKNSCDNLSELLFFILFGDSKPSVDSQPQRIWSHRFKLRSSLVEISFAFFWTTFRTEYYFSDN